MASSRNGSLFRRLYDSKIQKEGVPARLRQVAYDDIGEILASVPRSAFFVPYDSVVCRPQLYCRVYAPYVDKNPLLASMATPKKSPYYQLLQVRAKQRHLL